jgi:predicted PurR-regulated permease PerM
MALGESSSFQWPANVIKPVRWSRVGIWLGFVLLLVLLATVLRPVLTTVMLSFGIAWLLHPTVDRLERRGVPRALSILILLGAFFAIVAAAIALLLPLIEHELADLVANVPGYFQRFSQTFETQIRPAVVKYTGYELPPDAKAFWQENAEKVAAMAPDVATYVWGVIKDTVSNVIGLIGLVLNLILFPVFVFYLLKDFPRIHNAFLEMIPLRHRGPFELRLFEVDRVLSAFVRGQMTVAVMLAVVYGIGLSMIGIDLAIVIGALAGIAFVIPYAGYVLGLTAASAMALAKFGFDMHLLWVLALFVGAGLLEANVISPKLIGERVGLHPVVMITAVIVGGEMFGFLGILLAVPITAAGAVFWRAGLVRYKSTEFYLARK